MNPPAGSRDDHPPKLLWPDTYAYAVIINQDGNWEIYRSRHIPHTDATHIAATLLHIAEHLTRETP